MKEKTFDQINIEGMPRLKKPHTFICYKCKRTVRTCFIAGDRRVPVKQQEFCCNICLKKELGDELYQEMTRIFFAEKSNG